MFSNNNNINILDVVCANEWASGHKQFEFNAILNYNRVYAVIWIRTIFCLDHPLAHSSSIDDILVMCVFVSIDSRIW